ncbi:hypothetical protein [Shewanella oncorhynchi]|uniref:hypothetical protein n=1 Tax=Shewanella oncorhynchi TaxID=2726434 RepID=UPI003D792E6D
MVSQQLLNCDLVIGKLRNALDVLGRGLFVDMDPFPNMRLSNVKLPRCLGLAADYFYCRLDSAHHFNSYQLHLSVFDMNLNPL